MNRETEGSNYKASDLLVKHGKGKDTTPATVGSINKNTCQGINPQETLVKSYTKKQSKAVRANKATVGTVSPSFVSACQGVDPAKTSPKAYTKKTK